MINNYGHTCHMSSGFFMGQMCLCNWTVKLTGINVVFIVEVAFYYTS